MHGGIQRNSQALLVPYLAEIRKDGPFYEGYHAAADVGQACAPLGQGGMME